MKTLSQKSAEWNKNNKERYLANKRKSHHKNKERYNAVRTAKYRTPLGVYRSLKSLSPRRKSIFDLDQGEFITWYSNAPRKCVYCEIPEELFIKNEKFSRHFQFKRLSIDKIVPEFGYRIDNIVLCCYLCNAVKQNILTFNEMFDVAQRYIKPKWQNN